MHVSNEFVESNPGSMQQQSGRSFETNDEDPFVLIDESDEDVEDEDFILTNVVEQEQVVKKEDEVDVISTTTAGTKQLVFFISLLVGSYVLAINAMAGCCMLAKSLRVLDTVKTVRKQDVAFNWSPKDDIYRPSTNRPSEQNIPSLATLSSANSNMHPCHSTTTTSIGDAEQYMPSQTIANSPTSNGSASSPPDTKALIPALSSSDGCSSVFEEIPAYPEPYPSLDKEWDRSIPPLAVLSSLSSLNLHLSATLEEIPAFPEPSPSLDVAWDRPSHSPKRIYPSLSTLSVVQSVKHEGLMVVGDIIQAPPKTRPLDLPAIGGRIPYSPTLHIPSLAIDRVRTFWNWARDEVSSVEKNETANAIKPPAVFPVKSSKPTMKSELETFLELHGDRSVVLFFSSRNKSSQEVLQTWGEFSDKVRHTMKIDCYVEKSLCRSHSVTYIPTLMFSQNGQLSRELEYEADSFKLFTKYIRTVESMNAGPLISSLHKSGTAVVSLSHYCFRDFLTQNKHAVLVFDHLDSMSGDHSRQVWKGFAEALEHEGLNVVLATIDCHSNPNICRDQNIGNYPTIRWFTDGVSTVPDFKKQLVKKKFVKYARRVLAGVE